MKKCYLIIVLCSVFAISFSQNHDSRYIDGYLYVKVKDALPDTLSTNSLYLAPILSLYHIDTCYRPFMGLGIDSLDRTYRIRFRDTAKTQLCMDTLRTIPIIDYVEQCPLHRTSFTPNDINVNQWYLNKISATQAWNVTHGSPNVVIAIVDNGVRLGHEDLAANLWVNPGEIAGNGLDDDLNGYIDDKNGYDVADHDGDPNPPTVTSPTDPFNHGTHCSGIASGVTNNGKGIASIGFSAKIMAVKCTPSADSGNVLTNAFDGITYAIKNNANIISMSFGSESSSTTEQLLMTAAHNKGIVLVAAAGNENTSSPEYPASYNGVISVGATNDQDQRAFFSNFGPTVDIMAPGLSIYSTLAVSTTSYGNFSGTSMATPMVAGLASLVLAQHPSFTPDQVLAQIKSGADDISAENPGMSGLLGAGRINAAKTVGAATGIGEMTNFTGVNVYPNPAANVVYIKADGNTAVNTVKVFNMLGEEIETATFNTEQFSLDFATKANGVYFLQICNGVNTTTTRLIIEK